MGGAFWHGGNQAWKALESGTEQAKPLGQSRDQIGFARKAKPAICFNFLKEKEMSMQFPFGTDFIGVEVPTGVFPNERKKKSCFFLIFFFFCYFNVSI